MMDISLDILFSRISYTNVVTIISLLLVENSVILTSDEIGVLTPISEIFLGLMFPLWWQGVYIPVLPRSMVRMIDAPVIYVY